MSRYPNASSRLLVLAVTSPLIVFALAVAAPADSADDPTRAAAEQPIELT